MGRCFVIVNRIIYYIHLLRILIRSSTPSDLCRIKTQKSLNARCYLVDNNTPPTSKHLCVKYNRIKFYILYIISVITILFRSPYNTPFIFT
jgi:hypothetical protein